MKRGHIKTGIMLSAIIGLLVPINSRGDEDDAGDATTPTIVTVQTGVLKLATLHRYVHGYGTIDCAPATADQSAASAQLAAPSAGIVTKVNIVEGQHVERDEVLVELNSSAITYELARQEMARQKQLFAQQNTSLKNVQNAEAQVALLQVTAPLAGTVTRVGVKPGAAVDVTTVVAEVMDLGRLAVSAEIPSATPGLAPGEELQVITDPPLVSMVSYVSPVVNRENDTVLVRALLSAGGALQPGQFVPVSIVTAVHTNCLVAPVASVVTDDDGQSTVAVVTGDHVVQTRVKTGFHENDWVEIAASGLKPGDTVVTVGAYGLPDKTKIVVQNSPNGGNSATGSPAPK